VGAALLQRLFECRALAPEVTPVANLHFLIAVLIGAKANRRSLTAFGMTTVMLVGLWVSDEGVIRAAAEKVEDAAKLYQTARACTSLTSRQRGFFGRTGRQRAGDGYGIE
jgi:hypothetical protein